MRTISGCRILTVLFLLAFIRVPSAEALDVGVMGSYWSIDGGDSSWGAGAKLGVPIFSPYIKPVVRAYWFGDLHDRANGKLDIVPIDLGPQISFNPHGRWNPFVTGGSGWVYVHSDRESSHSNVGYFAGGGLEYKVTKTIELYTEALYRFLQID